MTVLGKVFHLWIHKTDYLLIHTPKSTRLLCLLETCIIKYSCSSEFVKGKSRTMGNRLEIPKLIHYATKPTREFLRPEHQCTNMLNDLYRESGGETFEQKNIGKGCLSSILGDSFFQLYLCVYLLLFTRYSTCPHSKQESSSVLKRDLFCL